MNKKHMLWLPAFCLLLAGFMAACGGSKTQETKETDDEAFYQTQPLKSGLYDADYFNISGANERKGHFDGRVYFALSPQQSALYVFENGNRTKIDYVVPLESPFEKNDSLFATTDSKGRPVTINTDSAMYVLSFPRGSEKVENITIRFSPKPRHTGTALDILEKMSAQKKKNSSN